MRKLVVMSIWMWLMNNSIKRYSSIIFNIILFVLEVIMIYLIIKRSLTKDFISPQDITFYEYLKIKLSNLV